MPLDALDLAKLLTDEYCAKILIATSRKPKSALELAERFGIPVAQCYRRIHALEEAGLLKAVERVLTQQGKRIYLYKSLVKSMMIYYEGTKVKVKIELAESPEPEIKTEKDVVSAEPQHAGEGEVSGSSTFSMFAITAKEADEIEEEKGNEGGKDDKRKDTERTV